MLIYLELGIEHPVPKYCCQSRCGEPRWYENDHEIVANPDLEERRLLLHRTYVVLTKLVYEGWKAGATCPNRGIRRWRTVVGLTDVGQSSISSVGLIIIMSVCAELNGLFYTVIYYNNNYHCLFRCLTGYRDGSTESGWQVDRSVCSVRCESARSQEWNRRTSCQVAWSSTSKDSIRLKSAVTGESSTTTNSEQGVSVCPVHFYHDVLADRTATCTVWSDLHHQDIVVRLSVRPLTVHLSV